MHKHGFVTIFILSSAVLCLFLSGSRSSNDMLVQENPGISQNSVTQSSISSTDTDTSNETEATAGAAVQQLQDAVHAQKTASVLRCLHYNKKDFMRSVNKAASGETNASAETIQGGIVPHHLLASDMIAAFFTDLSKASPETVIVLGPNHKLTGVHELHTSTADWGTPFGILESDKDLAELFIKEAGAAENNTLMENEHSVASLVPYIRYYMPDAKIVPLLIHGSFTADRPEKLGTLLADIINSKPGVVIVASIDFSHYLDAAKADEMDKITLDAIESWDFEGIRLMRNDNLDSVPSLLTLMTAMKAAGAENMEVTGHSNSSYIAGSGYEYTTSYFTMFFRRSGHVDSLP